MTRCGAPARCASGAWKLGEASISFQESGGKTLRQIAFPVDDDSTDVYPDHLFVGGTLYKRLP